MSVQVIVSQSQFVKGAKQLLEQYKLLSKRKIQRQDDDKFVLYTIATNINEIPQEINDIPNVQFIINDDHEDIESINTSPQGNLIAKFIYSKLSELSTPIDIINVLLEKTPKKWTVYPPLLLINNQDTFESSEWDDFFQTNNKELFFKELLSNVFGPSITNIALNKPIIKQDAMRRPFQLLPIYGDFGPEPTSLTFDNPTKEDFNKAFWCRVIQNGIHQSWAPRYTMFSRGNIKEKKRILDTFTNVKGNCVIDLYAGIGYFTLSYLKLGAKHLFCFELNPWSIQGLIKGAEANNHSYKLIKHNEEFIFDENIKLFIFHESNEFAISRFEKLKKQFPITHINLGLLPTSKPSWSIAESLFLSNSTSSDCDIHIHENVHINELPQFMDSTSSELLQISSDENLMVSPLHLEKIKTFAPDVWHICADFKLFK